MIIFRNFSFRHWKNILEKFVGKKELKKNEKREYTRGLQPIVLFSKTFKHLVTNSTSSELVKWRQN